MFSGTPVDPGNLIGASPMWWGGGVDEQRQLLYEPFIIQSNPTSTWPYPWDPHASMSLQASSSHGPAEVVTTGRAKFKPPATKAKVGFHLIFPEGRP